MTNDRFDPAFEARWPTIWRDGNERSSTVFDAEIKRFAHTAYQHGFAVGSGDEGYYQREIERLTRERDERAQWAETWHRGLEAVATILDAPSAGDPPMLLRDISASIERLRADLERAKRIAAMAHALPVTTEELRRIRNAGKITFDRMVNAITSCLIDMREA